MGHGAHLRCFWSAWRAECGSFTSGPWWVQLCGGPREFQWILCANFIQFNVANPIINHPQNHHKWVVEDGKSLSQPQVVSYGRFYWVSRISRNGCHKPSPIGSWWAYHNMELQDDGRRKRAVEEEAEPLMNPDAPWTHLWLVKTISLGPNGKILILNDFDS